MHKSMLACWLLTIALSAFGQEEYIVNIKGDTINGKLKIMSYDLIDRVQQTVNKKKITYTAVQLRSVFYQDATFVPVRFENTIRMMKVIRSGFLSLYSYRLPGQSTFDGRLLSKIGTTPQEIPNISFKKIMAAYLTECDEVASRIKNGEFSRTDVESIVDQYNNCMERERTVRIELASETSVVTSPTLTAIGALQKKVEESSVVSKKDVADLLNNISEKVKKKEAIPAYLTEGLKSYLGGNAEFAEDLEQLLTLLKN